MHPITLDRAGARRATLRGRLGATQTGRDAALETA